ncbi:MAG: sialidase family protein [Steroidobacteraceae bacterium]
MPRLPLLPLLVVASGLPGCARVPAESAWLDAPVAVPAPAAAGSRFPRLAQDAAGHPVMSWLEPDGPAVALRYARWRDDGWSPARTVARGTDWFVNWADFPSVVTDGQGHWAAHWLEQVPGDGYAYGVRLATSGDGGTWSAPWTPHGDGTPTEHGFVSLLPWHGGFVAVWLDGRHTGGSHDQGDGNAGGMTLRSATIDASGRQAGPDVELDGLTCDCCQTGAALAATGPVVVYRDRGADGTRDISIVRLEAGHWSAPAPVARDGWAIDACPVNGPAVDADGNTIVVAWFTGAGGARVRVAFSRDSGRHFDAPVDVDTGRVEGRVDVALLEDGRAVVSWLRGAGDTASLLARPYTTDGPAGRAVEVTRADASRAGGFPQVARAGEALVFAWTESGPAPALRTVTARLR